MSVLLNDSSHLCTSKLGRFFLSAPACTESEEEGGQLTPISSTCCFFNKPFYSVEVCISVTFFCIFECFSCQSQVSLPCDVSSVPLIVTPACLG